MTAGRWNEIGTAVIATLAAATLAGCAAGPIRYVPTDKPAYTLSLWLAKKPLLDPVDVLASCNEWQVKGVTCRLAASRQTADVVIDVGAMPCHVDGDGNRTLAYSTRDGHIVLFSSCFEQRGRYDYRRLRTVITHEIGHVMGIWDHVPAECDGAATPPPLKHPSGRAVCGAALMNLQYDRDVPFVTDIDGLAFDLRDTVRTRLKPLAIRPTIGHRDSSFTDQVSRINRSR